MTRRQIGFAAIALVAALGFISVAQLAHRGIVDRLNRQELRELTSRTLTRAEVAVDLVVITMFGMIEDDKARCGPDAIAAIHRATFAVGTLKDIHIIGPDGQCSGFSGIAPVSSARLADAIRRPARNAAISLAHVDESEWAGLGIVLKSGDAEQLIALMSTDSLLFDMLPAKLREDASMELNLDDVGSVARFDPPAWAPGADEPVSVFTARSSRYPLATRIVVRDSALAGWSDPIPGSVLAMVIVGAIIFGIFTAGALLPRIKPDDELDIAIVGGEIVPYFQPIMSLSSHKIVGCEMLARWIKPDGSQVSPANFIPLAEISGQIDKITDTLLRQAGSTLGPTLASHPDFKLTFNVTPGQFLAQGFVEHIQSLAKTCNLPQERLVVEITERQEIASIDAARAISDRLAAIGVRVAIDDTGTGHNGLASIQRLGAACMKVDKFFIDAADDDHRARTMIETLVKLANTFGMTTIAEGIERPEQVAVLLSLGVREGQGYLFSRPLPADEFIAFLEARNAPVDQASITKTANAA